MQYKYNYYDFAFIDQIEHDEVLLELDGAFSVKYISYATQTP